VKFSNRGIAQEMVRALNELGYAVDIVSYENTVWAPYREYDLFIGHGGINFVRLASCLPKIATRIYFSTGMYWREANERLATRLHWLALRRGALLPAYRAASEDEEAANQAADGIICLGNEGVAKSYSAFGKVVAINNAVYPVVSGWGPAKDFDEGRKHFLFFAGRGNVLKGLDLLLEAFRGTDMHLHVCQHLEPEFEAVYSRECTKESNIHIYGHIAMRSAIFEELVRRCNWVISATCTEGQPGAVLECMGHGLIPVIPDSVHIDADSRWSLRMPNCDVETIRDVAAAASRLTPEVCREMSIRSQEEVRLRYTPAYFREAFKQAIEAIVRNRQEGQQ
jgi:glycosyltransferase involved in cell wall biosynthesis